MGQFGEAGEDADGVGAAAHAGHDHVGIAAGEGTALLPGLVADDPVELPDHPRVGVRAHHRAEAVVGDLDVGHPGPQRVVHRVLQRAGAALDGDHLGPQQPHAEHVQRLARHVDRAHVHDAVHAQQRGGRGGGDAVLAGAGLGDQPRLAHPPGEQRLAQHVVDLVAAGVVEVLPLEQQPQAELGRRGGGTRRAATAARRRCAAARRSSARKAASAHASRKASSSAWQAGTSVSGTNWPPKRPKRPRSEGAPMTSNRRRIDASGAPGTAAIGASLSPAGRRRPVGSGAAISRALVRTSCVVGPVEGAGRVGDVARRLGALRGIDEVPQLDGVLVAG